MTRLLFVHAHPDDETLTCGVTMAHHAAAGDDVHVLTCTLGEEGEVIPPELAHLEGAEGDPLGAWRRAELREAMGRLGADHAVLGEDRAAGVLSRYRDSGMAGTAPARHPSAFASADVGEVAALVATHIRSLHPDVVVTYDRYGGYGHPDHIQTHRVTRAALALLAGSDRPARAFEIRTPRSWARADRQWLQDHVDPSVGGTGRPLTVLATDAPYPPGVVDDALVSHAVLDAAAVAVQAQALAAHATQLRVFPATSSTPEPTYALSNDVAARLPGREGFARVDPATWTELAVAEGPADGARPRVGLLA